MDARRFYVAMSRHRSRSWILLGEGAERRAVAACRPLGDARPIRHGDIWAHAAQGFARQPQSETATAMLERASTARRGAEDAFRVGLVRIETRRARNEAPTVLPAQGRRQRLARALSVIVERIEARATALAALAVEANILPRRVAHAARIVRDLTATPARTRRSHARAPAPRP